MRVNLLYLLSLPILGTDLCGVEVTGDYPHEEVARPGVNHFPKGVFQICLTVIDQDKKDAMDKSMQSRHSTKSSRRNRRGPTGATVTPVFDVDSDDESASNVEVRTQPDESMLEDSPIVTAMMSNNSLGAFFDDNTPSPSRLILRAVTSPSLPDPGRFSAAGLRILTDVSLNPTASPNASPTVSSTSRSRRSPTKPHRARGVQRTISSSSAGVGIAALKPRSPASTPPTPPRDMQSAASPLGRSPIPRNRSRTRL